MTELEFKEGEQVVFRARADGPEEIHVHGYDIEKEVGPEPVRVSFPATITGIFEIELHGTGRADRRAPRRPEVGPASTADLVSTRCPRCA